MAAHSVTILTEAVREPRWDQAARDKYLFACDRTPGMDELTLHDWNELRTAFKSLEEDDIVWCLSRALCAQLNEWERLGKPDNHEEWVKARRDALRVR